MSIAQNSSESSRSLNLSHSGGMIDAIADWCDALRGGLRLQDAFAGLAAGLRADAGMLVRTALSDFRPSRIAIWDRSGTDFRYPLSRSFADSYFGSAIARPRTASLWRKSDFVPDSSEFTDPALEIWQEHRGFSEYVVLVLASGSTTRDHIELHFRYGLSSSDMENLEAIVPTMGRIWATRQVGLVTRCVVNHRRPPEPKMQEGARLLSIPNPARLSRAEFRVCLLLSRGLSVLSIAEELNVSEATIRTHLRNIYAKTHTAGMPELVYHLVRGRDQGDLSDIRYA
jgi:DNA-binding NarL/FixJ family response regulator